MNYAFLPDLMALTILIVILLVMRRRHPQKQADVWLLGLFLTLVEAVAHTFYAPNGAPNRWLHLIVVDCYLLAGLVFTLAAGRKHSLNKARVIYIGLNGVALLAINSLYGLHYRAPQLYLVAVAAGLVIGATTSIYLRRSWFRAVLQVCGWLVMGYVLSRGNYRQAVYWSLCCVYTVAAVNFQRRLPKGSTGKLAIVTGFSIWALCFVLHPWIVNYVAYADIASHIWNMQKSLISIGMILVMLEEQLLNNEWLALHDELTGLPNRRSFEERLTVALERARRTNTSLALLVMDLNGFKKINDSLGHQAGDQVLREVARNLRGHRKSFDTLARLGGDEFTLIAAGLPKGGAIDDILNQVSAAVESPIMVEDQVMVVTASLGFAIFPDDGDSATKLFRVADERMYRLKRRPFLQPKLRTELPAIPSISTRASSSSRRHLGMSVVDRI